MGKARRRRLHVFDDLDPRGAQDRVTRVRRRADRDRPCAVTTRATPAATSASAQGGVAP